jgi:hypothetical protein
MATHPKQGGAQALPIARAFIATGGRLYLTPTGKLETAADLRFFGPEATAKEARLGFVIGRRFFRRLRDPRFTRSVATLVAIEGERAANGCLVMEAQP